MNILQSILEGAIGGAGRAVPALAKARPMLPLAHLAQKLPMPVTQGVGAPGGVGSIPVGQALTPENIAALPPEVQGLAQIYNTNPQDPRVAHLDPAMFGYAADNTVTASGAPAPVAATAPALKPWTSPITGAGPIQAGKTPYSLGEGPYIPRR